MNKFYLTIFLYFSSLAAAIYEIKSIEELYPFITEETLVISGFDCTIAESKEPLGSKPWRAWIRSAIQELENKELAPKILLAKHVTNLARAAVPLIPIEGEQTIAFFDYLNKKDIPYFFITARPKDFINNVPNGFAKVTLKQLKCSGVPAPKISIFDKSLENGFLFATENAKGDSVKELLESNHFLPKRVIFFDNSLKDIDSVQVAMEKLGIEFFGLHFFQETRPFDPLIANLQFETYLNDGIVPDVNEILDSKKQDATAHFNDLIQQSYEKIVEKSFSLLGFL